MEPRRPTHAAHTRDSAYAKVWVALVALTLLSAGASMVVTGSGDVWVALSIAVVKTVLVGLFFMHLLEERFASGLAIIAAFLLVGLLVGLTAADVATRRTFPAAVEPKPAGLTVPSGR